MSQTDYDPFSAEVLDDPASAYAGLLAGCPVHRFDGFEPPFYSLSRHEDVSNALRDVETFSSRYGQGPRIREEGGLKSDPPEHTVFRRLVQRAFTPKSVSAMEPFVRDLTVQLIDEFAERGHGDLYDELAYPIPTTVIAAMIGVPPSDRPHFKIWSDAHVAALSSQDPNEFEEERLALSDYIHSQIADRQRLMRTDEPLPDDLMTSLLDVEVEGQSLSSSQVLDLIIQLLVGGNETTTSLITNAILRLAENPSFLDRIREHPELSEVAVEESLRFDSPVLGLFRTTANPVDLHGIQIPVGSKIMLLYAAANRDPRVFENPNEFSLDRDLQELRRRHLAFGAGPHLCLGAALSRLEGRIVIQEVANRLKGLRIVGQTERVKPFLIWGKRTLPCEWDAS